MLMAAYVWWGGSGEMSELKSELQWHCVCEHVEALRACTEIQYEAEHSAEKGSPQKVGMNDMQTRAEQGWDVLRDRHPMQCQLAKELIQ